MFESLIRKKQVLHQEVSHIHETPVYKNSILNEQKHTVYTNILIYMYKHNDIMYITFDTEYTQAHKMVLSRIGQQCLNSK